MTSCSCRISTNKFSTRVRRRVTLGGAVRGLRTDDFAILRTTIQVSAQRDVFRFGRGHLRVRCSLRFL